MSRPIDFCLPPCSLLLLSQSLVSFLLIGPVSFTDGRINRGTSLHVGFWLYVTKMLICLSTLPKLHHWFK